MYWYSLPSKSVDKDTVESKFNALQLKLLRLSIPFLSKVSNILFLWNLNNQDNDSKTIEQKENTENTNFIAIEPKFKLEDVIMPESVKRQINRSIVLIRNRKKIYEQWGFSNIDPYTKIILCFYGEPGTGKTMCAHALAKALDNKSIIEASYASIESKWVGEGPKNLRAIFEAATQQNAVLFFDEADSFLSKRSQDTETSSDKHYNRMSNEMFQLLENFNGIVIFATNLVSDFDKAFKSRILSHIEFVMPDEETRLQLINSMLNKLHINLFLTEENLRELSIITDGFSGRDIRKSILITLTNVAVNNSQSFNFEDFKKGFLELKNENNALTKVISNSKSGVDKDLIKEFIDLKNENKSIMCLCLHAAWLGGPPLPEIVTKLTDISKILSVPIPDTSNNSYLPSLENVTKSLVSSTRKLDTIKFMTDIIVLLSVTFQEKITYLEKICVSLEITNNLSEYLEIKQNETDLQNKFKIDFLTKE
ncbi:MAG: ATP-binding protein [Bacteroidales bacterium]|nr:ATP-binding protein [Bacteroidales bacterium]